jgi:hypothetical protein
MARSTSLALIFICTLFSIACLVVPGNCGGPFNQPQMPPNGFLGQACPPAGCGPGLFPPGPWPWMKSQDCNTMSLEIGGRGYLANNMIKLGDIDFIKDLNLSQTLLVGEIFGALRLAPSAALTYSFMFPRYDDGNGVLPVAITIGSTTFAAGTPVYLKTTTVRHKWEGEYFFSISCNYRIGAYLLGELWVEDLRMQSAAAVDTLSASEFLMGAGGSAEYAPSSGVFLKVKAAYTFLQKQTGVYLDGEGKIFPNIMGCQSGIKPYLSAGYRFWTAQWDFSDASKLSTASHGPYFSVGFIF